MQPSASRQGIETIKQDQYKIYLQALDLICQALHVCIVRDVIREDRYRREEALQQYNIVVTISHVSLENYAIQQLWKLFDKKSSVFNLWNIVENIPHTDLKIWFDNEIKKIEDDITNLNAWRHNVISHRSEIGHSAFEEFQMKFPNRFKYEEKIKDFLLNFLSQAKFYIDRTLSTETKGELTKSLENYKQLVIRDKKKVLIKYN